MPNQEEYIMMGMAAYGDPEKALLKKLRRVLSKYVLHQKYNFHEGITDWG
jgi:predicted NodU family carbamoyl transferase